MPEIIELKKGDILLVKYEKMPYTAASAFVRNCQNATKRLREKGIDILMFGPEIELTKILRVKGEKE